MFTNIHIDDKWCTLQLFMDENHVHVWDENSITSSSAWRMKVVHRMLGILFPATITMWGTSPLDHEGNDQSSPFLHFPTWTTCVVLWLPFSYGKPPHFPMWGRPPGLLVVKMPIQCWEAYLWNSWSGLTRLPIKILPPFFGKLLQSPQLITFAFLIVVLRFCTLTKRLWNCAHVFMFQNPVQWQWTYSPCNVAGQLPTSTCNMSEQQLPWPCIMIFLLDEQYTYSKDQPLTWVSRLSPWKFFGVMIEGASCRRGVLQWCFNCCC